MRVAIERWMPGLVKDSHSVAPERERTAFVNDVLQSLQDRYTEKPSTL